MTQKVKLHVGYIGKTREGKRVEIVSNDFGSAPFLGSDHVWRYSNGKANIPEHRLNIIGPWEEDKPEYETGVWYGWNGRECPVHPETVVSYIARRELPNHYTEEDFKAGTLDWSLVGDTGDIIAFRIVTPYVEPEPKLECWVNVYDGHVSAYTTAKEANAASVAGRIRCARMVEADDKSPINVTDHDENGSRTYLDGYASISITID